MFRIHLCALIIYIGFGCCVQIATGTPPNSLQQSIICPRVPSLLQKPDLARAAGVWYKIAATPSLGKTYECNVAYNNWNPNTKKLQVTAYNYQKNGQKMENNWNGDIYINSSGKITNTIKSPVNTTMAYWTFFGDNYETYQISYGCPLVNGNEIGRLIWIQSKNCNFNEGVFNTAVKLLAGAGVTNVPWVKFANKSCCPDN